jgi:hypothetical protein
MLSVTVYWACTLALVPPTKRTKGLGALSCLLSGPCRMHLLL